MRQIIECKTHKEIVSTYQIMKYLRPHLSDPDNYAKQALRMFGEGFRLVGLFEDGICHGVMGFRTETRFYCGRMIYVDDLVTDETQRSSGVGQALIDWIKQEARKLSINNIILDSGTHRSRAHKFYFREGFHIGGFNFRIDLSN